jgi:hypothetical protein
VEFDCNPPCAESNTTSAFSQDFDRKGPIQFVGVFYCRRVESPYGAFPAGLDGIKKYLFYQVYFSPVARHVLQSTDECKSLTGYQSKVCVGKFPVIGQALSPVMV